MSAEALREQARRGLKVAAHTTSPAERYAVAHLAALRGCAAVLAERTRPDNGRRRPRSAWALLPEVAPELSEWAAFFAARAARRSAIDAGVAGPVTPAEADDLVRDVGAFLNLVDGQVPA